MRVECHGNIRFGRASVCLGACLGGVLDAGVLEAAQLFGFRLLHAAERAHLPRPAPTLGEKRRGVALFRGPMAREGVG